MTILCGFARLAPALFWVSLSLILTACSKKEGVVWVNPLDPSLKQAQHLVLDSGALGHSVGVSVHLPEDYRNSQKSYPVIYFLHGVGGDEVSDVAGFMAFLRPILEEYQMQEPIVVFPNGGVSNYQGQVEPMIIGELIPFIDRHYRTIAKAQFRAVTGFSMGGAGAIRLSIRYPGTFGGAVSWGGGMWRKDTVLLNAAAANAPKLRADGYYALMINGEHDNPAIFAPLQSVLNKYSVANERVVLNGVDHNLSVYMQRSEALFGDFLQKTFGKSASGENVQ